jgi:hypothetical protein
MLDAVKDLFSVGFRSIVVLSLTTFVIGAPFQAYDQNIKVLVLIIASDQFPVYSALQEMWRSYMHVDPEHIEAYFIKGDERLPTTTMIKGDIIWSKTRDDWIPASGGILNKTILSLEMMMPRIREFDYILRTNLSSFYVFPRLLQFLKRLPKTRCYCGSDIGDGKTGSGCGFIMSPDVVKMLVKNKRRFLNVTHVGDDEAIGSFLRSQGIRLIPQKRMNFFSLADWYNQGPIPHDIFHFRVKNDHHELRLTDDIFIQSELLKMFYHKSVSS